MSSTGASLAAVARHTREPIDGIWTSRALRFSGSSEFSWGGDHTVASTRLLLTFVRSSSVFRFARTPRLSRQDAGELTAPPWQLAVHQLSQDLETAWDQWHACAEDWLRQAGVLQSTKAEQRLGSAPRLKSGTHAAGPGQHAEERQLRRHIRRLQEALALTRRGAPVPGPLHGRLVNRSVPQPERQAAQSGHCGVALQSAQGRLETLLVDRQRKLKSDWVHRVHSVSGAASWCKQQAPPPVTLVSSDNAEVYTTKPHAAKALYDAWKGIFGSTGDVTEGPGLVDKFGSFIRQSTQQAPRLGALTGPELRRQLGRMKGKTASTDGWTPEMLLGVAESALSCLAALLCQCEREGGFPESQCHWRCVFLPKSKGCTTKVGDVRPIAIASIFYRLWGATRFRQCAPFLTGCLDPYQAGGVRGPDCETLLLDLDLTFPPEDFPFLMCLDYRKAFDSVDCTEALRLLEEPQGPAGSLRLARLPMAVAQALDRVQRPCSSGTSQPYFRPPSRRSLESDLSCAPPEPP